MKDWHNPSFDRLIIRAAKLVTALAFNIAVHSSFAANNALILDSPPGDWVGAEESWYYTAPDASFTATRNYHNGVTIEVRMGFECWFLDFAAPFKAPLTVGNYEHASRYPFEDDPAYDAGLDIAGGHFCGNGRGCNTLRGSFVVSELELTENGDVISFRASFIQYCEQVNPPLQGEIFFNSTAAIPPPHHITSLTTVFATEGQPFRYQITTSKPETNYSTTGLPAGLTLDPGTGVISGYAEEHGQFEVTLAASGQYGSASATLHLWVDPPGRSTGPYTALWVTSETGESILNGRDFSGGIRDAIFFGVYGRDFTYSCKVTFRRFERFIPPYDISNEFYLILDAPRGAPLAPGEYFDTDWEIVEDGPQVDASVGGVATNEARGSFTIKEISASPTISLEHLRASFVQFANWNPTPSRGWVWFRAENVITSCPFAYGKEGTPFQYQIVANNEPTSYSCGTNCLDFPPGLSLDPHSGRITGTPLVPGSYNVTVHAVGPKSTASETLWFKINRAQALANISTRAKIGVGENSLIGGFNVVGRESKRVVIRAIGPSLTGLTNPLADPFLKLHDDTGAVIAFNHDWRTNQAEIEPTGLAPSNDLESAIVTTLAPGSYTAIVTGENYGTGVGMVEVYDISPSSNAHLANVSTRSFVQGGENVLIGGLIVAFGSAQNQSRILIRGLGPTISYYDIENYLSDPVLDLHDANGAVLASNDTWRSDQEFEIIGTGIPPIFEDEAAILVTLNPGSYTAIVRGKNNTTGIALVEAYQLDN